jgi:hypothetical protein
MEALFLERIAEDECSADAPLEQEVGEVFASNAN